MNLKTLTADHRPSVHLAMMVTRELRPLLRERRLHWLEAAPFRAAIGGWGVRVAPRRGGWGVARSWCASTPLAFDRTATVRGIARALLRDVQTALDAPGWTDSPGGTEILCPST